MTTKYIILAIGIGFYLTAAAIANATTSSSILAKTQAQINASAEVEIPVLNRLVKRGELITDDMLDIKVMSQRRVPRNAITDSNQLLYKEVVKNIRKGIPLFERNIRIPPTIHKGDIIAVAYEKPGLSLVADGKALSDGAIGEKIQVLSFTSNKIIIGRITSHSKVKVN